MPVRDSPRNGRLRQDVAQRPHFRLGLQAEVMATAKRLLLRYTERSFTTVAQWRKWLEENRDRIYFSDVAGYKFRVIPKGYLKLPEAAKQTVHAP